MRVFYYFLLVVSLISCSSTQSDNVIDTTISSTSSDNENITNPENLTDSQLDSIELWVSIDFLNLIEKEISICNCWKQTKYHLLFYDTTKMELYLKSNLMHFGHDSEIILPLLKQGDTLKYDSISNDCSAQSREFKIPSNDTLNLIEGTNNYQFIRKTYTFDSSENKLSGNQLIYYRIRDLFYQLNSLILLKYTVLDSVSSSSTLITPDGLKELINDGKVTGHCSDDYYYNGITIKNKSTRHFHLVFNKGELILYDEKQGRDKGQELNLDTLKNQIMLLDKN